MAGAWIALSDFGASWLWMTTWPDRGALLVRAVGLLAPMGALLALAVSGVEHLHWRARSRWPALERPAFSDLLYVGAVSPFLLLVARLLFTGGSVSKLPFRGALVGVAFLVLAGAVFVALATARRLAELARGSERARAGVVASLALGFFVAAKLNQHVLPQLYEYLHVCLSIAGFVLALFASLLAQDSVRLARVMPRVRRTTAPAVVVVVASLAAVVLTFDLNPNVRVALHEPRTPHARSVMQGIGPGLRALAQEGLTVGTPRRVARARAATTRGSWRGAPLLALREAHVLLVTIDALRADHLGAYGYGRGLSPNLDRLAGESVVFERAYAAAPHSSYSLSSLMTSEYLHEIVELDVVLPESTLPLVLQGSGYVTAAFFTRGIFHTEGERLTPYRDGAFGFQRHQHDNPRAEQRTDQLLAEVDRVVEQGEPPSLVWGHYFDTHEPYLDTSLGTSDLDRYDSEIRNVDTALGRLIEQVRAKFERPVVIVVTADHGEEFHEHGGVYHGSTLYDEQIRVPLIIHAEGITPRRVSEPVSLVDVAPTVLGLLGEERASSMRGQDLRPAMMGLSNELANVHAAVTHKRMVVAWPYKLVADLRFDLYELYDLASDPGERRNLAGGDPERVRALREDVYAWLDEIRQHASRARDEWEAALDLGRLRDRRAVDPLSRLVAAENVPTAPRVEAARLLGRFADARSKPSLVAAMNGTDPLVAAEAAIALGRMFDQVAAEPLRSLVRAEDPGIRTRAGISLARLGDATAVPSLLETLRTSRDQFEREEAVRWLGRLGDAAAMEELVELLGDFRIRHLTVVSLGQLHDARALPPLLDALTWEHHATIRNNLVRGLGELGDARAIPTLLTLATSEPELDFAGESLLRTRALERNAIGGFDFDARAGRRVRGLEACTDAAPDHEWLYVGKTHCIFGGRALSLSLRSPSVLRESETTLVLLRARSLERSGTRMELRVGGTSLGEIELDGTLREHRFEVPSARLRNGSTPAQLEFTGAGQVELDYVLLLPAANG